jgi:hypothetical protein
VNYVVQIRIKFLFSLQLTYLHHQYIESLGYTAFNLYILRVMVWSKVIFWRMIWICWFGSDSILNL